MRRECRERFLRHCVLAIPAYIAARAWRTRRYACQNRYLAVSFEVGGWENVPGACAIRNFTYLVTDTCPNRLGHDLMSYKLVTSSASNHYSNPISTHCQFNTKTDFFRKFSQNAQLFSQESVFEHGIYKMCAAFSRALSLEIDAFEHTIMWHWNIKRCNNILLC